MNYYKSYGIRKRKLLFHSYIVLIQIPGKTFLLGEYAVLQQGPALIACTAPYFTLTVHTSRPAPTNNWCFHPHSPAGKFLQAHQEIFQNAQLTWTSPYPQGGFGGSTAEFLACYQLYHQLTQRTFSQQDLYQTYLTYAYQQTGIQPSGADLIAQTQQQIVYFQANTVPTTLGWPFDDLSLLLFKTPYKLATHQHLETLQNLPDLSSLSWLTQKAHHALQHCNTNDFIQAINQYAIALSELNLTAAPTLHLLEKLKYHPSCLAIKGCGAHGADVIAAITSTHQENNFVTVCQSNHLTLVATHRELADN